MPGWSDGDVEGTGGRVISERFRAAAEDEPGRCAVGTRLRRLAYRPVTDKSDGRPYRGKREIAAIGQTLTPAAGFSLM
jgi:hypothetical protein